MQTGNGSSIKKKRPTQTKSELGETIAREVVRLLLPRVRKIVREEVDRSVKDLVYESVVKGGRSRRLKEEIDDDDDFIEETRKSSSSSGKRKIADTMKSRDEGRRRARQMAEQQGITGPFADLITDVMTEEEEEEQMYGGESESAAKALDIENMDFSAHMERLFG